MPRRGIITKMKFIGFGSGSSGNCYYLLEDGFGLVIDQGIGIRSFKRYFRDYGLSQGEISAILVTHDHTDHVKAVGAISQEYHLPVYAAGKVHEGMENNYLMSKKIAENNKRVLMPGEKIVLGPFTITAFEVPHDASANNGYFITTNSTNFCLMTDCGKITEEMCRFINQAENLVIEANYDEAMLMTGPYPLYLKNRIQSGLGHSSNVETASALVSSLSPLIKRIWLCHLSEENNHPELCRKTIQEALDSVGCTAELCVLKRRIPTGFFDL